MSGEIPVINLGWFLEREADPAAAERAAAEALRCAEALREYGVIIVRDPRVTEADNDACVCLAARVRSFLDLLESYFETPDEEKQADVHPELR